MPLVPVQTKTYESVAAAASHDIVLDSPPTKRRAQQPCRQE